MLNVCCLIGSDPELIFLTDGLSKGVMQILNAIIRGEGDGEILFHLSILHHFVSSAFLSYYHGLPLVDLFPLLSTSIFHFQF